MIDKLITKVIFLSICIVIDHINSKQLLAREEIGNDLQEKLSITKNVTIAAIKEETFGAEANPTRDTM